MINGEKANVTSILSFILGLLACNNIVYVFKGESTNINISLIYSIVLLLYLIFKSGIIPAPMLNDYMEPGFKFYTILVFILTIPSLFIFSGTVYDLSPLKSLLSYILVFSLVCNVIMLKNYKDFILKGLFAGFLINLFFSVIQLIFYQIGVDFTFEKWFPQMFFQNNIYWYRAQGLFTETSYYAAFAAPVLLLILSESKNVWFKIISLVCTLFLLGVSFTGNIVNVLFGLFLYVIFILKRNTSRRKAHPLYLVIIMFGILCLAIFSGNIKDLFANTKFFDNLLAGFSDAVITNTQNNVSNTFRLYSQKQAFTMITNYPLGVGYNMSSPLLILKTGRDVYSSFNVLITNQLEIGIFGTIAYLIMIFNLGPRLLFKGLTSYQKTLGISIIVMFIAQVGNGIRWFPHFVILVALAGIEYSKLFSRRKKDLALQLDEGM